MICYPVDVKEIEVSAINDYWEMAPEKKTGYFYTVEEVNKKYQPMGARSISFLIKNTFLFVHNRFFFCEVCGCKSPVNNRMQLKGRILSVEGVICDDCRNRRLIEEFEASKKILADYKSSVFEARHYLDDLGFIETLAFLTISYGKKECEIVANSVDDLEITGLAGVDQDILMSLIKKKALVNISEVSEDVRKADHILHNQDFFPKSLNSRSGVMPRYNALRPGVYLRPMNLGGGQVESIGSVVERKLNSIEVSSKEVMVVHDVIKGIQVDKLYRLIAYLAKDLRLPVRQSKVLATIVEHVATKYPPVNLFYTFRYIANGAIVEIHKGNYVPYIADKIFAKKLSSYIAFVEEKNLILDKALSIPIQFHISPFENVFSGFYLMHHLNWNKLSVSDVLAQWLDVVPLSEDAQRELFHDE